MACLRKATGSSVDTNSLYDDVLVQSHLLGRADTASFLKKDDREFDRRPPVCGVPLSCPDSCNIVTRFLLMPLRQNLSDFYSV